MREPSVYLQPLSAMLSVMSQVSNLTNFQMAVPIAGKEESTFKVRAPPIHKFLMGCSNITFLLSVYKISAVMVH